jgi:hypothetical protein
MACPSSLDWTAKGFTARGRCGSHLKRGDSGLILPPENVSLSKAVLMRKGSGDDEVEAGTLHACDLVLISAHLASLTSKEKCDGAVSLGLLISHGRAIVSIRRFQ